MFTLHSVPAGPREWPSNPIPGSHNCFMLHYVEMAKEWGGRHADFCACMDGFEFWPERWEEDGVTLIRCPLSREDMAISPKFGHPVGVTQAKKELHG